MSIFPICVNTVNEIVANQMRPRQRLRSSTLARAGRHCNLACCTSLQQLCWTPAQTDPRSNSASYNIKR